jgi:hypothetical protein
MESFCEDPIHSFHGFGERDRDRWLDHDSTNSIREKLVQAVNLVSETLRRYVVV